MKESIKGQLEDVVLALCLSGVAAAMSVPAILLDQRRSEEIAQVQQNLTQRGIAAIVKDKVFRPSGIGLGGAGVDVATGQLGLSPTAITRDKASLRLDVETGGRRVFRVIVETRGQTEEALRGFADSINLGARINIRKATVDDSDVLTAKPEDIVVLQ